MKDMLLRMVRMYPGIQRSLMTCSFNIPGIYMNQMICMPLITVSKRASVSINPSVFIKLIKPIFKAIYGIKLQMENTLKSIEDEIASDDVLDYGFKKHYDALPIPICFTSIPTQRKRKLAAYNLNDDSSSTSLSASKK
ncbi:hypothetical protein BDC45DRAFT_539460 [Circinella umbellata]|nr:hypothetical protein BDC45DRAFT_539460 [Circinella umbellata]